jgi:NAD(P)-dependent dehydrogenase (short-subunit alcohol dehydrogenase family)
MTKSLAVEYAAAGIRFNTVAPARVRTAIGVGLAPLAGEDDALRVRPPRLAGRTDGASRMTSQSRSWRARTRAMSPAACWWPMAGRI